MPPRKSFDEDVGHAGNPQDIDGYVEWFNNRFNTMTARIVTSSSKPGEAHARRTIDISFGRKNR